MRRHLAAPAGRTRRVLAGTLAISLSLGMLAAAPSSATTDGGGGWAARGSHPHPLRGGDHPSTLVGGLHEAAERGRGTVTVVVESPDASAARRAIARAGGTVEQAVPGLVEASVPAAALDALADDDGVTLVRPPYPIRPAVESEGVEETGASAWRPQGTGDGTKVAILDGGFAGYLAKLGTELPLGMETDFGRCTDLGLTSDHGTAVAEIVHDMAPDAELRLICIESDVDFISAMSTMAANGIDVVNGSFGFILNSRLDGSGPVGAAAAALRDQGILYVASAGNYQGRHFNVNAAGDPVEGITFAEPELSLADNVDISSGDTIQVTLPPLGVGFVGVQWDAWPTTRQDFDLFAKHPSCEGSASLNDQAGFGETPRGPALPPWEAMIIENCLATPQVFEVFVDRWYGSGTPRLDFWFDGDITSIENTSGGSVADPATSAAVLAVGAHCESSGTTQPYSSRGPTIDGRIKPDISGPDATSSSVYGPQTSCSSAFTGTSASAPHVAGAAALLLEANPALDVAELQQLLEDKAQEAGAAGKDNAYGSGRLRMGPSGSASRAARPSLHGHQPRPPLRQPLRPPVPRRDPEPHHPPRPQRQGEGEGARHRRRAQRRHRRRPQRHGRGADRGRAG